jgi:hypothetical protein
MLSFQAHAYMEYSVRFNIINCTACHLSPVGGGPKTVDGKLLGAHGYKINPVLAQDYISADFRALYYYPQRVGTTRDGAAIMAGSVAGHAALDNEKKIQLVIEHNIAGFAAAPYRDTYALFKFATNDRPAWFDSVLVGRFRAPFGLVTDEHRTYTRIETSTSWNNFETGLLLSGTPSDQFHYDLALVNGEMSAGQTITQGQAERFGGILNVRWLPGPALFGISTTYHDRAIRRDSAKAVSLYSIISLSRLTNNNVPLILELEHVRAWGWNSGLAQDFASDANYVSAIKNSESQGWVAWIEWPLSPRFNFIYKYDLLTPDRDYPSDFYDRHGLGIRYVIGPNVLIQVRTEIARATPPSENGSASSAVQNATYGILQLAL